MKTKLQYFFIALALLAGIHQSAAQGTTAFTYQGQLRDGGTNANGTYTMIFALYDSPSGGDLIGGPLTNSATLVNGLFTVNLNFGATAFNGSARWLDITVSNGVAQTLSPRVEILPAPYALYAAVAATVTNGAIMNAQLAANAVTDTNIVFVSGSKVSGAVALATLANSVAAGSISDANIASGQVVKSLNGLTDFVALTAGANTALFNNGNTLQMSATVPNVMDFTSSGTFVVPTNVTRIMVEMWGAGGGGGSGYVDANNNVKYAGGGGGAGAYTMNVFTVTPGSSYPVTVPGSTVAGQSGGTASFGALMSAGGGQAGANATAGGNGAGGAKGTATGGLFVAGDNGQNGSSTSIYLTGATNITAYAVIGGQGGGVWRGSPPSYLDGPAVSGSGGGGSGGSGSSGFGGNAGLVRVYY